MMIVEDEKKMKEGTRVQGEEKGGIFPLQEEVKRIVLEHPAEPLSILVSQSWKREETEG